MRICEMHNQIFLQIASSDFSNRIRRGHLPFMHVKPTKNEYQLLYEIRFLEKKKLYRGFA